MQFLATQPFCKVAYAVTALPSTQVTVEAIFCTAHYSVGSENLDDRGHIEGSLIPSHECLWKTLFKTVHCFIYINGLNSLSCAKFCDNDN